MFHVVMDSARRDANARAMSERPNLQSHWNGAYRDYGFADNDASHMHRHFLPPLFELGGDLIHRGARVLDVGCGNGFTAGALLAQGCSVVGIDPSASGVELARKNYPQGRFEILDASEDLLATLSCDPFDLVISTEVIEHLYSPRSYIRGCFEALRPGGRFICTTPYHGYLKNVLIAVAGMNDAHANPLWDGGHIKQWSRRTLSQLLAEAGFINLRFRGAGRVPWLWMTMLMAGDRPLS
jgi:2-polyprenyl-3-methyl-5-hydroxy-6-metoxy-1,4-benzoquinol methylase